MILVDLDDLDGETKYEKIICHGQLFLISLSLSLFLSISKSSAKLKASEKQPLHFSSSLPIFQPTNLSFIV